MECNDGYLHGEQGGGGGEGEGRGRGGGVMCSQTCNFMHNLPSEVYKPSVCCYIYCTVVNTFGDVLLNASFSRITNI